MIRIPAIIALLLVVVWIHASDFNRIPESPASAYPFDAWLYFANDGLGHNFGGEEDDLRTYGFTSGFAFLDAFLVTLDWESFNDRNSNAQNALRNDELKTLAGFRFLKMKEPGFTLSATAGIGGMLYGNFGSLGLQTNAHSLNNTNARHIPEVYDLPSQSGLAFVYSELFFPSTGLNFTLYSHVTHKLDYSVDASAAWWMEKEFLQVKFMAAWQVNQAEGSGSVVRNVTMAENGLWLGSRVMVGPLVYERSFNPMTGNQSGNAGFRFELGEEVLHPASTPGYRFTWAFGFPIGHNSNNERFTLHPFGSFDGMSRLGLFLGMYQTEDMFNTAWDRRIKKMVTLGAEFYFQDPDDWHLVNAFLFAGAGFNREVLETGTVYRSQVYREVNLPAAHAGMGVRLELPDVIYHKRGRYLGALLMAKVQVSAGTGTLYSNPYFLLSWAMFVSER